VIIFSSARKGPLKGGGEVGSRIWVLEEKPCRSRRPKDLTENLQVGFCSRRKRKGTTNLSLGKKVSGKKKKTNRGVARGERRMIAGGFKGENIQG